MATSEWATDPALEAAARRYLTRVGRRWGPGLVTLGAALLAVALVYLPSATRQGATANGALGTQRGSGTTSAGSGAGAGTSGEAATGPGAGSSGANTGAAGSGPAAAASGQPGLTASGVQCAPGVRQVTWSHYAPLCAPSFHGDNGGAAAPGVTPTTVTITYRISNSGESAAVEAAAGAAAGGTDQQYIADLQNYVNLFNRTYELYGRHVVLKPYTGQGDWLQEIQGQDLSGAQADAATAHDMGAFADVSVVSMTQPYAEDLANQHVLSFGVPYLSQSWFDQYSPYAYSYWPTNSRFAAFTANLVCQRMAGQPAAFAGDPTFQRTNRVFGLIVPENPVYSSSGDDLTRRLAACGVKIAKRVNYALNIETAAQQAANAMAQMHSAGVTTILCGCDPIAPIFDTQNADQQNYHPEWSTLWWGDPYGRDPSQDQWSHATAAGGASPAASSTEAFRAYKLANPSGSPAEIYYTLPYWQALMLFDGLQAAGPRLTPASFARGFFSLPASQPGGDFGPWSFGQGTYTPKSAFQVGWWDPNATSAFDNKKGAWQNCNGGAWYAYDDVAALGPAHTQLGCFGH